MSGGRFEYLQFRFGSIVEDIRSVITNNDSEEKDEWGQDIGKHLPADIIAKFADTADTVERAEKMATRVDWLLSGDDGEECFRRRWVEDGLGETEVRSDALLADLITDMVRLDDESLLPDGDMVHVGTHSWAAEWVKRLTDAGYIPANNTICVKEDQ